MNGKEFLDYLKKLPEERAIAIIDGMNKTANEMADKIIKYESVPAETLISQAVSQAMPEPNALSEQNKICKYCKWFTSFRIDYEDELEPDDVGFCKCLGNDIDVTNDTDICDDFVSEK